MGATGIGETAFRMGVPTAAGARGRTIPTQAGAWHPLGGVGVIRNNRDARPPLLADPERRLTLRQADQAREDFAQILDELDFVKGQLARLPTRSEVSLIALRLTLGAVSATTVAALLMGR